MEAATRLVEAVNKAADENLPRDLAEIVKGHAACATTAAVASGWLPGVGATAAVTISAGFIWTMYGRINSKIGAPFSENIIKSLAAGVVTNLAANAATGVALSTVFSLFPGVGTLTAVAVIGSTCYVLTMMSGVVYMRLLTNVFNVGKDPTRMSAQDLQNAAKEVMDSHDMARVMREARNAYKGARERGEI